MERSRVFISRCPPKTGQNAAFFAWITTRQVRSISWGSGMGCLRLRLATTTTGCGVPEAQGRWQSSSAVNRATLRWLSRRYPGKVLSETIPGTFSLRRMTCRCLLSADRESRSVSCGGRPSTTTKLREFAPRVESLPEPDRWCFLPLNSADLENCTLFMRAKPRIEALARPDQISCVANCAVCK